MKSLCLASHVLNTISSSATLPLAKAESQLSLGVTTGLEVSHSEHSSSDSVESDFNHVTPSPMEMSGR